MNPIPIPMELLSSLGYDDTEWVSIRHVPSDKTRQRLINVANAVMDIIASSCVCPISRSIPIQQFKESLLAMDGI